MRLVINAASYIMMMRSCITSRVREEITFLRCDKNIYIVEIFINHTHWRKILMGCRRSDKVRKYLHLILRANTLKTFTRRRDGKKWRPT